MTTCEDTKKYIIHQLKTAMRVCRNAKFRHALLSCVRVSKMQGAEIEEEGSVLTYMTKSEIEEQRSSLLIMTQRHDATQKQNLLDDPNTINSEDAHWVYSRCILAGKWSV